MADGSVSITTIFERTGIIVADKSGVKQTYFCNSTILRQMFAEKNFHNLSAKAKFSSIFVRFILWMIKDLTSRKAISWKQTCLLLIVTFISSISGLFVSMSSWKNSDVIIDYRNRTLDQNGLSFKMTKNFRFVTRN